MEDSDNSEGLSVDEAMWRLTMISLNPHPSMTEYIVHLLLGLARSQNRTARYMAVANRMLPDAQVVFMQNDEDKEIRAMVKARLEYGG